MKTLTRVASAAALCLAIAACCGGGSAPAKPAAANTLSGAVASAQVARSACEAAGNLWDPSGNGGNGSCITEAPTQTDPNGQTCLSLDSQGYCPGDDPLSAGPAEQTDPNGQTCDTLDDQGYCPGDDPSPAAPAMTKQTDIVVFSVSGSGEPSIQYGTDSSEHNPSDGAGPLGDGNYLPWHASMTYDPGALYYAVSAQLEGSGNIKDSVTEVVTTWCSGSSPKKETFELATGNASGGYAIAQAEYAGGDTGNAMQAESDAGC